MHVGIFVKSSQSTGRLSCFNPKIKTMTTLPTLLRGGAGDSRLHSAALSPDRLSARNQTIARLEDRPEMALDQDEAACPHPW